MSIPRLHRISDRQYSLIDRNVGALRECLAQLPGFSYYPRGPTDLCLCRWSHDRPGGRSMLTLFPSFTLTVLGPPLPAIDEWVECEVAR
jgi:hypothetical protein